MGELRLELFDLGNRIFLGGPVTYMQTLTLDVQNVAKQNHEYHSGSIFLWYSFTRMRDVKVFSREFSLGKFI